MKNMGTLRMKKIALIEDRYSRQNHFLDQNSIDLNDYENVLENFVEEKASNLLEQISNNSFDLSDFEIIVCHKSVENNTVILGNLKNYCQNHNKTLVLFSGGISVNYYDNTEFEILELNSKTFYSQNLVLFLEALKTGNEDVLMLCYGEHWKQNIVANALEKTNLFIFDLQNGHENSESFSLDHDLNKVDYEFYDLKIKSLEEIIRFRDSLMGYFEQRSSVAYQKVSALIHCDNVCDPQLFSSPIKFVQSSDEIDVYISQNILKQLAEQEFDILFIKDNLSTNYLELYGLRVAHHVRLSSELGDKRYVPIVIISDFDANMLNAFQSDATILFTEGVYVCKNTKEDIVLYQSLNLDGLNREHYADFLQHIRLEPPKDTSGSHDIANKWSIYRWADVLNVETETTNINKEAIENKLYFKYLKALNTQQSKKSIEVVKPTKKGKVLLIDDEWSKGWADVINKALKQEGIEFGVFEYDFKDKTNFNLIMQLKYKNLHEQIVEADVIVLDLRLIDSDHEHDSIDDYSGIKILEKIHEINAGIQVIMLTATSKSTTLEKLYEKKILGYIKKEHPEDTRIYTVENNNKLIRLVDKGLERKYLKEVFLIQKNLEGLPLFQIKLSFDMNESEKKLLELKNTISRIFETLDSNIPKPFVYGMLILYKCLEIICDYFIYEQYSNTIKKQQAYWRDNSKLLDSDGNASVNNKVQNILRKLGMNDDETIKLVKEISCSRNYEIHPGEIKESCKKYLIRNPSEVNIKSWLKMVQIIIDKIRPH